MTEKWNKIADLLRDRKFRREVLMRGLWLFLVSLALFVVSYIVASAFFSTEDEKRMILENEIIKEELPGMELDVERLENVVSGLQERDREIYRIVFDAPPPDLNDESYHVLYETDPDSLTVPSVIRATSERIGRLSVKGAGCMEKIDDILDVLGSGMLNVRSIPSIVPVKGFKPSNAGASMGMKMNPWFKRMRMHNGVDITASEGTEVVAAASGTVSRVTYSNKGDGNTVSIDHGNGYVTVYSHLGSMYVKAGRRVEQGDRIAVVGTTGTTFLPHLHYEVLFWNRYQDPVHFFFASQTTREYRQTMTVAMNNGQSLD